MNATGAAPTLLLAGFEPFGGEAVNPSMLLVDELAGTWVDGHRIAGLRLPVTFDAALSALAAAIDAERPAIVLGLGLAGGRARLSLERVALNLIDARIPDNGGSQPIDQPVIAGAPAAHFSTLPVKAMLRAMLDRGVPAELSLTAGTYVCNAVMFAALQHAAMHSPNTRAGFLHLPYLPSQAARHPGAPSLDLATMRDGVLIACAAAVANATDVDAALGTIC